MSGTGTGKGSRQQPKGDIPPAHFVASALQLGIFPENVAVPQRNGAKIQPEAKDGTNDAVGKSSLPVAVGSNSSTFVRIKCTDGALDALKQCHSEFLVLLASELAAVSEGDGNDDSNGPTSKNKRDASADNISSNISASSASTGSKDGKDAAKCGAKKRPRNDAAKSSASADAEITLDADTDALSRILTEKDVMACMERLGMSRIAAMAMENIEQWNCRKNSARGSAAGDSTTPKSAAKKAKKLKKGFRDKDVTAEMIAEQERLLAESARAMKERLKQQKEGSLS